MAKFHDIVGFTQTVETSPGVWEEQAIERTYYGDIIRMNGSNTYSDSVNPNIRINHAVEILADEYALSHISDIRYARWMNNTWKVTSFEVKRPRIVLYLGENYVG